MSSNEGGRVGVKLKREEGKGRLRLRALRRGAGEDKRSQ